MIEFKIGDKVIVRKDMSYEDFEKRCFATSIEDKELMKKVFYSKCLLIDKVYYTMSGYINFNFNGDLASELWSFNMSWFEYMDYMDVI